MNKENRVMCRLTDEELKKLRIKSSNEDEGNISLTLRKALNLYLKK